MIIQALQEIQREHGYVPAAELRALAERSGTPVETIERIVDFYPFLHTEPSDVTIRVCRDAVCHMRGAERIKGRFEAEAAGKNWRVLDTSCLGQCDGAPTVTARRSLYRHVAVGKVPELTAHLFHEEGPFANDAPSVKSTIGDLENLVEPYETLRRVARTRDFDAVVQSLIESGLRGMGGAGFPAGLKWKTVREAPNSPKTVVCNADESEPGTFKDRVLIHTVPHWIVEGVLLGALVVGAQEAVIFIRHQYRDERAILEEELGRASALLASLGWKIPTRVFPSPGGYICGEETALLEALEGKRPQPRLRPPFPATHGYHGQPTLLSNVETFAWAPVILTQGADWFRDHGRNGGEGLKAYAVSGRVRNPGVYITSMGITARELIDDLAGGMEEGIALKAFSPGGVSAGFLPASMADTPLEFGALQKVHSMLGTGAVIAVGNDTCMLDLVTNATRFFEDESCGKCTPCRAGTTQLVGGLTRIQRGQATEQELQQLIHLSHLMRDASFCGLGQAAPNPFLLAVEHFEEEILGHLHGTCPAGVCFEA